jgi:hypothetical protein
MKIILKQKRIHKNFLSKTTNWYSLSIAKFLGALQVWVYQGIQFISLFPKVCSEKDQRLLFIYYSFNQSRSEAGNLFYTQATTGSRREEEKEQEDWQVKSIIYLKSPQGTEHSKMHSANVLHPFSASQYKPQEEDQSPTTS